jgi:hypothetical protein
LTVISSETVAAELTKVFPAIFMETTVSFPLCLCKPYGYFPSSFPNRIMEIQNEIIFGKIQPGSTDIELTLIQAVTAHTQGPEWKPHVEPIILWINSQTQVTFG